MLQPFVLTMFYKTVADPERKRSGLSPPLNAFVSSIFLPKVAQWPTAAVPFQHRLIGRPCHRARADLQSI